MLFNSPSFIFFYIIVTVLYFALPFKFRWLMLLLASCYFYMSFVPVYILILGFTIIVDYAAGIFIEQSSGAKRKLLLVISLISNIGILVVFKYFNFLNDNVTQILSSFHYRNVIPYLTIILPIGLSFHTFQAMSYTIEVYRGNQKAERHFGIYSLYVMFYPQLVAGPIERPQNMLHQFHTKHNFNYGLMTSGLKLMAWGLFKKVVIADRLAVVVNTVYADPKHQSSANLLIAVFFFAFQIYCDFSGYSDIAIGAARTMGFKLMTNFNSPFQSKNVTEFWRRWHISLSTWFNDYLFTPLVLEKRDWGKAGVVYALLVTFLISGIWHGAGYTFIIFGLLNGLALVYEFLSKKFRKKLSQAMPKFIYDKMSMVLTFAAVTFFWIFFRSPNLSIAFVVLKGVVTGIPTVVSQLMHHHLDVQNIGENGSYLLLSFLLILFLECFHVWKRKNFVKVFENSPVFVRWSVYGIYVLTMLSFGVFDNSQFIYFQF